MWHRDMKWADAVGKMALRDQLHVELPQTLQFVKQKAGSAKHNEVKMRFMPINIRAELSRTFYLVDTGMEGGKNRKCSHPYGLNL